MLASKAFVVAVLCVAATAATPFEPCEHGQPPKSLRINGCDSQTCILYRGEDISAEWDFTIVKSTDNLKPQVLATALGVTVPYALPEQDACNSLTNGECPLDEGDDVTYSLSMPILELYPKVRLLLQFSILDEAENVHVCFKIRAKVADKEI